MIKRSWHRLVIGNGLVALGSIVVAILVDDSAMRWLMVGNAIGLMGLAAWALRKDDGK